MWVPKKPRPIDFCGCPPCPMCFVYQRPQKEAKEVTTATPIAEVVAEPVLVDGVVQMGFELLGREPTEVETPSLLKAAQTIHQQNLLKLKDKSDSDLREATQVKHMGMVAEAVIKAKLRERTAPKVKPLNTVTIDTMDLDEVKKKTKTDAAKKAEKPEDDIDVLREQYIQARKAGRYGEADKIRDKARRLEMQSLRI